MTLLPVEVVGSFMEEVPVDVISLSAALGLEVRAEPLKDDVSGKIECTPKGSCRITVNAHHGPNRQRFTIAHEIAHFVLHRDLIGDGIKDDGLYRSNQPSQIERQANFYAANILMPSGSVRKAFASGAVRSAEDLASLFRVSPAVAAIRMQELNLTQAIASAS